MAEVLKISGMCSVLYQDSKEDGVRMSGRVMREAAQRRPGVGGILEVCGSLRSGLVLIVMVLFVKEF